MTTYKRTSRKTADNRRKTITLSPAGNTVSESTKYGDGTRRTISSRSNGKTKITTSSKTGGGYLISKSYTLGSSRSKKSRSNSNSGSGKLFFLIFVLAFLVIILG